MTAKDDASEAARLLGKLGGRAGRGASKRRPLEHYRKIGLTKHACPQCGREIAGNIGLWRHLRAHAKETPKTP